MNFGIIEIFDWIKKLPDNLINLTASGLTSCESLSELGVDPNDVPLSGDNLYGYPPLKEVIAAQYRTTPDRIAITPGASMANFALCAILAEPGSPIRVETPVYQPFVSVARAVTGLEPLRLERKRCDDYHIKIDNLKQNNPAPTKLLMMSNLHNPSGVNDKLETFALLADTINTKNGWVVVDEVFLPFVEGGERQCAAQFHDRVISTCSLTKVWGLSTLRIGWVIAEPEIVRRIKHTMDYMHVVQPFITEYLAWKVLEDQKLSLNLLRKARRIASSNLELVNSYLNQITEFDLFQPDGGISMLIRFKDGRNSQQFTDRLFKEFNTVVVPGRYFEINDGFRLSFGVEKEIIRQGLEAIVQALQH